MSKKLEEKQRRRLAEERKRDELHRAARRRNLVTAGVAVVVAVVVVLAIVLQRKSEEEVDVGVSESAAECTAVKEQEEQGADHIEVGTPHEPYAGPAPTSGPHYAGADGPVDPGFYDTPLPPEGAVHNLEHGQIVIWYSPDAPEEVIQDIEAIVDQERFATVALPYPDLQTDKSFVLTAWAVAQECDQVSQQVVDEFRRTYQGKAGPEKLTPPFEG
ncbi:MAG: DUF3105 domain-containing protein [Actinomycetota bacterium]